MALASALGPLSPSPSSPGAPFFFRRYCPNIPSLSGYDMTVYNVSVLVEDPLVGRDGYPYLHLPIWILWVIVKMANAPEAIRFKSSVSKRLQPTMAQQSLARMWEGEQELRTLGREKDQLTKWPGPTCIGIPSIKACSLNHVALEYVAQWWTARSDQPAAVPINMVRSEAG